MRNGAPAKSILTAAAAAIVACSGLIVLAVWRWDTIGWGALVWLAGLAGQIVIRAPYARAARIDPVAVTRKNANEKLLLAGMFLTMMVLPLLHLTAGVFDFANYTLPGWATGIGAAAQLPFLWLFWRSHADLGGNWSASLELRENHGLVTKGVYGRIRHPMYGAIWIATIAQPLLIHNWIAGLLIVPAFAAMWFLRVPKEEAMMRDRFGDAYDIYCRRAGRLIPKGA